MWDRVIFPNLQTYELNLSVKASVTVKLCDVNEDMRELQV